MKKLIKKILREESEKNPKSKLENLINTFGIVKVINMVGLENLLDTLNLSETELFKKYNPFEKIFTDKEFENQLFDSVDFATRLMKSESGISFDTFFNKTIDYIISLIIDGLHWKLIDWDSSHNDNHDWIVPNTPEVIKLIYGDRIKNSFYVKRKITDSYYSIQR